MWNASPPWPSAPFFPTPVKNSSGSKVSFSPTALKSAPEGRLSEAEFLDAKARIAQLARSLREQNKAFMKLVGVLLDVTIWPIEETLGISEDTRDLRVRFNGTYGWKKLEIISGFCEIRNRSISSWV